MKTKRLPTTILALLCLLFTASLAIAQTPDSIYPLKKGVQKAKLLQLATDFHGAFTLGDYDLMFSLWAEDAVYSNPAVTLVGPEAIADFFTTNLGWGRQVSLAPNYKTLIRIHGDTAYLEFECILVDVGDLDPLTTSLSTLPPGAQNPAAEIVAHLTASTIAVKKGERWVFQTFSGSAGPIIP